jgi:predicted DsbA family dithiol-disulfide isomerase
MTYNSRFAQELGVWAAEQGKGEAYHDAVFRAYFVDGANIASREVLLGVVAKVGLDVETAATVLGERRYQNAVNDDWERSMGAGVTGIPTFDAGGKRVEGAEPYDVLERLVVAAGARKRPPATGENGPQGEE